MALTVWWIPLAALAAVIVVLAIGLVWGGRRQRPRTQTGALVSRAERIRRLPAVRRATRLRLIALSAIVVLAGGAAVVGGVVTARPVQLQTIIPENHSRDIMLCLDVSGSMSDVDVEILDVFTELLDGFEGERIGLTIFNASPVQVFPLTDDYAFIEQRVTSLRDSIENRTSEELPEQWTGTLDGPGSSLIGDGLAACALRFDHAGEERSRSIILATDNELVGQSIVSLEEAAAYSASHEIRVFALNPIQDDRSEVSRQLVQAAEATDGEAYGLRGATTVGDIIADVQEQEARALMGTAETVETDAPAPWIIVLIVTVFAGIVVAWRARV
ncbi:VWA domain-containing protein [Microbacterium sp. G2-8]|uniref:vWA domain-containing protein n=1 Tax=Microbacterium sp. G2-8 TaxID=2842454 RepID=UPI0027E233FC|nr:VWA domain-containing protein [Microbacterium sp. G2-8]